MAKAAVSEESSQQDGNGNTEKAAGLISSASKWSAAAGFIPVPYVDLAALAAVQVKMVNEIAELYGTSATNEWVRTTVSTLLGTLVGAGLAVPLAASTAKLVPVLGSVAGGIGMGLSGAASTYAVGKVFVNHFENGGTLEDFSVEAVKEGLKSAYQEKTGSNK
jgi:uncharacterized protein (DUF697 family)